MEVPEVAEVVAPAAAAPEADGRMSLAAAAAVLLRALAELLALVRMSAEEKERERVQFELKQRVKCAN